jgi:hypothetical protein
MDYVPQNIGFYDTYYDNFKESDCRVCHGASTKLQHHNTQWALENNCLYCHNEFPIVVPTERDCKVCHTDAWVKHPGTYGFPHHRTDWANSDQCTQCHDSELLSETNTVPTPGYDPGDLTPTPFACENCHWPSGMTPHQPETYPDQAGSEITEFTNDWLTWYGSPKPTTYPSGDAPQPIESNGKNNSGLLWPGGTNRFGVSMPAKPWQPAQPSDGDDTLGLHHEIAGSTQKCYNCHASSPGEQTNYDVDNLYLIRFCENCHDIYTLHGISEHVTTNDIYTVAGQVLGPDKTVYDNWKCVACHGDNMANPPERPATAPKIKRIVPNTGSGSGYSVKSSFGSAGIIITIYPDTAATPDNFGPRMTEDGVVVNGVDSADIPLTLDAAIYDWPTDGSYIKFKIPAKKFKSGSTIYVRVRKLTDTGTLVLSTPATAVTFINNKHPEVSKAVNKATSNPSGPVLTTLKIKGVGFGVEQEDIYSQDSVLTKKFGYSTYVEIRNSADIYRATLYDDCSGTPGTWGNSKICVKLDQLWDVNAEATVPGDQLYAAECWNVVMITDYVSETVAAPGVANKYLLSTGELDPADALLWREESDPVCFNVTDAALLSTVSPNKQYYGSYAALYGIKFGDTPGKVQFLDNVSGALIKTITPTDQPNGTWANGEIVFKVPNLITSGISRIVKVRVKTSTGLKSNTKQLTIKKPGT